MIDKLKWLLTIACLATQLCAAVQCMEKNKEDSSSKEDIRDTQITNEEDYKEPINQEWENNLVQDMEMHTLGNSENNINNLPTCHKKRLLLGEADFSYTCALLRKHPNTKNMIVSTELRSFAELGNKYETFQLNLNELKKQNVIVEFGVDATKIHEKYACRFHRIHFNFPHDGSNYKAQTLPIIIKDFFTSASQLQEEGDRLNVVLPYLKEDQEKEKFYLGHTYRIFDASKNAGYKLIKKRKFKEGEILRYPGYKHCETKTSDSAPSTTYAREYIFQKSPQGELTSYLPVPYSVKQKYLCGNNSNTYDCINSLPFLATDNDSSYYSDNESTQFISNNNINLLNEENIQQTYDTYYQPKELGSPSKNIDGDIVDINAYLDEIETSLIPLRSTDSSGSVDNMIKEKIALCRIILEKMDPNINILQQSSIELINLKIAQFEKILN